MRRDETTSSLVLKKSYAGPVVTGVMICGLLAGGGLALSQWEKTRSLESSMALAEADRRREVRLQQQMGALQAESEDRLRLLSERHVPGGRGGESAPGANRSVRPVRRTHQDAARQASAPLHSAGPVHPGALFRPHFSNEPLGGLPPEGEPRKPRRSRRR